MNQNIVFILIIKKDREFIRAGKPAVEDPEIKF